MITKEEIERVNLNIKETQKNKKKTKQQKEASNLDHVIPLTNVQESTTEESETKEMTTTENKAEKQIEDVKVRVEEIKDIIEQAEKGTSTLSAFENKKIFWIENTNTKLTVSQGNKIITYIDEKFNDINTAINALLNSLTYVNNLIGVLNNEYLSGILASSKAALEASNQAKDASEQARDASEQANSNYIKALAAIKLTTHKIKELVENQRNQNDETAKNIEALNDKLNVILSDFDKLESLVQNNQDGIKEEIKKLKTDFDAALQAQNCEINQNKEQLTVLQKQFSDVVENQRNQNDETAKNIEALNDKLNVVLSDFDEHKSLVENSQDGIKEEIKKLKTDFDTALHAQNCEINQNKEQLTVLQQQLSVEKETNQNNKLLFAKQIKTAYIIAGGAAIAAIISLILQMSGVL